MGTNPSREKPSSRSPHEASQEGYSFIRKGSGLVRNFKDGSLRMETLTHGTSAKTLEVAVVTVEPGASCNHSEIYIGEKWFYILEGKLEMLVNEVSYFLEEGDSIYLEPTAVHTWRNSHNGKTRILVSSSLCSLPADARPV